jgi:hypothetical protein
MHKHLNNGTGAVKHIGTHLREVTSASWRALLAAELVAAGFTFAEACAVTGASYGYVTTLRRLQGWERAAVRDGHLSLAQFHTRTRAKKVVAEPVKAAPAVKTFAINTGTPTLSNSAIDNIVREVGVERMWASIDRLTQPSLPVAAE